MDFMRVLHTNLVLLAVDIFAMVAQMQCTKVWDLFSVLFVFSFILLPP